MSATQHDDIIRFRCQCGAVLAARARLAGRKGKCKTCGGVQVIPAVEQSLRAAEAAESAVSIQEMCSVCQTAIEDDDERTTCGVCRLPFHNECWRENLGCSAYGCTNVNVLKQGPDVRVDQLPAPPPQPPVARAQPPAAMDEIPWDHLLVAAGAIGTVVGIVTYGAPVFIVIGLAIWRIVLLIRRSEPVALPVLTIMLSVLGLLIGLCSSLMYWKY